MAILIVKLKKQVFHDEESDYYIITARAGKENISLSFSIDAPKVLKTVEYKVIGDWRKQRNGKKIFDVERYERIGKVCTAKARAYDAHLN